MNKDVRKLLRRARRAGCRIHVARSGHYRVLGPNGGAITIACSPAKPALDRIRNDLRRIGARI